MIKNPRVAVDLTTWSSTSGAAPTRVVGGFTHPTTGVVWDCASYVSGSSGYDSLVSGVFIQSAAPLTAPRTFTGSAWVKVPNGISYSLVLRLWLNEYVTARDGIVNLVGTGTWQR